MKNISFSTPKERKYRTQNRNDKATDKSILFRLNLIISHPATLIIIFTVVLLISVLLINYLFNTIPLFLSNLKFLFAGEFNTAKVFSLANALHFKKNCIVIYFLSLGVIAILDGFLVLNIRNSYYDFNRGQKGSERFASEEELKAQYIKVPIKSNELWDSKTGGIIISRQGNYFLVDEQPGHNLIVGTTRSGKGEMFVRPMIEMLSRCSCLPSMIFTDPKMDLSRNNYEALKKRGYDVIVLNLINALAGDHYNPFDHIIDLYQAGEIEKAYQESRAFAYSIFWSDANNSKGKATEDIWNDTATDLLSALIIANIEDCLELDRKERAEAEYDFKCRQIAFTELEPEKQEEILNEYRNGMLDIQYARAIPPECTFNFEPQHIKEINMFSVFNNFRLLAENVDDKGQTALDKYFKARPLMNKARVFYSSINISGYRTKTSIYTSMISKLTAYSYDSIARMTAYSDFKIKDIGFGDKPKAIFIAVPDYDASNHFFITTFIRQVYYILSSECAKTADGKCKRPVWCILDEFANTPPLDNIQQMVSIGAGLNIFFNFIIQDFAQLDAAYTPEIAKIIRNNCQNQIFIKSNEYNTAEEFSKLLGKETITTLDRIGRRFAVDKTFTERKEEKALLDPNELMNLAEGECVVKRVMKRKTLSGKDTTPYPIFNTGKSRMPYAHTYLPPAFCVNLPWEEIYSQNADNTPLSDFTFDIVKFYNIYVANVESVIYQLQSIIHYQEFYKMLLEDAIYLSSHILKTTTVADLMVSLSKKEFLPEKRKEEYRKFLSSEQLEVKALYRVIKFN